MSEKWDRAEEVANGTMVRVLARELLLVLCTVVVGLTVKFVPTVAAAAGLFTFEGGWLLLASVAFTASVAYRVAQFRNRRREQKDKVDLAPWPNSKIILNTLPGLPITVIAAVWATTVFPTWVAVATFSALFVAEGMLAVVANRGALRTLRIKEFVNNVGNDKNTWEM